MAGGLWYVAVFSLAVGVAIPAFWLIALAAGGVPEVAAGRRDIWFHIAAELVTGLTLLAGGIAVLVDHRAHWSGLLSALGLGMLFYTLIVSPGYYVERRNPPMLWMFAGIWLAAVPAVVLRFAA